MSTFTGINDYVSQVQPEKKDLQFYGNVLQTKQSAYNANHAQLSGLYGSLLNADLTRDDSNKSRDDFFQLIGSEIQKISGMDLSLESNKIEAGNVFSTIYDDKNMVKDMVWTKNFKGQLSKAEAFKNCIDPEKCGGSYWEQGEKYMHYKAQEFKNAGLDEVQSFEDVSFVPYTNVMDKAIKYAKDAGISVTQDQLVGNYMVTTKNGPLAVGPLTSLFSQVFENNPQILKQFEVDAYVNRKDGMNSIMAKTGISESQALGEYLKNQGQFLKEAVQTKLNSVSADEEYISTRIKVLDDLSAKGKVPKGSTLAEEHATLKGLLPSAHQATEYFTLSKTALDNASNTKYIKNIGASLDRVNASLLLEDEVNKIANTLAYRDSEQTAKADDFAKKRVDYQYDAMLQASKHQNNIDLEKYKNDLKNQYPQFGGNSTKDPLNNTLNASIDNVYKKFAGTKEVKGDPKIEQALSLAKEEVKKLKIKVGESKKPEDEKLYVDAENKVRILETKNNEILRRKKVEFLDKNGLVPTEGFTWGNLYGKDRVKNKRTGTDYDRGVADELQSSSIYDLLDVPSPTSDHRFKTVEEVSKKQNDIAKTKQYTSDLIGKRELAHVLSYSEELDDKTRNWYKTKLTQLETNPNALSTKEKTLVAKRINYLHSANKVEVVKDPSRISDKSLTDTYASSNIRTQEGYISHYNSIVKQKHENTKKINLAYINETKGTSEYEKLNDYAKNYIEKYIKKYGHAPKGLKQYGGLEDFNINKFKTLGSKYGLGVYQDGTDNISESDLEKLISDDKYFSNSLYDYHVKQKLVKPNKKFNFLNEKLYQADINNITTLTEKEQSLTNLKKEKADAIRSFLNAEYGGESGNIVDKNGGLMPQDEYIRKYHWEDTDILKDNYVRYRKAYYKAVDEAWVKKTTKEGNLQMPPGSEYRVFHKFQDINLNHVNNLEQAAIHNYMDRFFQMSGMENRQLFIQNKNGVKHEITKDVEKYNEVLDKLKSQNAMVDVMYAPVGGGTSSDNKDNWEQLRILHPNGLEYILSANPYNPALKQSSLFLGTTVSQEQQIFLLEGKKEIYPASDITGQKPIIVRNTEDGIKLKGKVVMPGMGEVDIMTIFSDRLGNERTFTDLNNAKESFDAFIEMIKDED